MSDPCEKCCENSDRIQAALAASKARDEEAQARIRVLEARLNGRCSCDGAGDSPCSVHGHEMAQQDLRVRAEQERDSFAKHVAMLREAVCAARSRIGFQEKKTSHIKECGCELCFDALAICQVAEALEATSPAINEWMEKHDAEERAKAFEEVLNNSRCHKSVNTLRGWLQIHLAKAREAGEKK